MWVLSVFSNLNGNLQRQQYILKGPACSIGRSPDSERPTIPCFGDKSISRQHVEIRIEESDRVIIADLGSKFGTCSDGTTEKLPHHQGVEVRSGQSFTIGAQMSRIVFEKQQLRFCITRLDKDVKNRIKIICRRIGAKTVSNAEEATHVVSNKFAATVKILTAIVLQTKIVTPEWLNFAEADGPFAEIPDESRQSSNVCFVVVTFFS